MFERTLSLSNASLPKVGLASRHPRHTSFQIRYPDTLHTTVLWKQSGRHCHTIATKLKSPALMVLEIALTWRDAKMFYGVMHRRRCCRAEVS